MPSVRFIEPAFTRQNPSTNGLVDVVSELMEHGWAVEVFSHSLDPELEGKVFHRKAPRFSLPFGLAAWVYFLYYHWQGLIDCFQRSSQADITVSTGYMYLPADFATVHFSHFNFVKEAWLRGRKTPGFIQNLILETQGVLSELIFLWNPWKTRLLVVSDSVADDMRRLAAPWKTIELLPNRAITDRFFPTYREQNRGQARRIHGFCEEETVLLFASAGHHFRKGFFKAVDVIARLREKGLRVRFLVVGGRDATLSRLRRKLGRLHPGFEEWIEFTGSVENPEFHFSAADALFFPSLSEAFSLVEIEAAALGLPLYLTAHHGSEMILRDGQNGRLLPWDIAGMVELMESEIRDGKLRFTSGCTGRALSKEAYAQKWLDLLEDSQPCTKTEVPAKPPMPAKPRLMLIGHTYMIAVNREKAVHLADYFEVMVCTCETEGWKVLGQDVVDTNPPNHESAYQLRRLARWPRTQSYTRLFLRGLQDEILAFQPDIVLVENEPWAWMRWQARWATWRAAPEARFAEFTWENVERPGITGVLLHQLYRAAAATGDLLICGNKAAHALCVTAGYNEKTAIVGPQLGFNPQDHPAASVAERETWRTDLGWPATAKVVGFCGRLVEEKGLFEFVEAARSLREKYPELRVALVGEGPLRKALEGYDPEGRWLKVLPPVRHEAVPAFLNKLDIFVLPSKPLNPPDGQVWEEQFGHVLIEAMACGVLTLGSDSGAIPEVLNDPSVTFPHSNIASLASIIDDWLGGDDRREAKANEQRQICANRWTHAAVAKTYAAFLNPA
jgi:glycosyltransferase involved in cell wall biosynthesis